MNKTLRSLAALLALVPVLGSCYFGLEPSWKKTAGTAAVSIDFSSSPSTSRAISGGAGYLYIRTLGGPTGDKGPFYGPYSVPAGGVFATTDIPAGTYGTFAILYSAVSLDSRPGFTELMKLPDADFEAQAMGENSTFDLLVNGDASGATIKDLTVQEGVVNAVSAVLRPFATESLEFDPALGGAFSGLPDTGAVTAKKYMHLINVNAASDPLVDTMVCTAFPSDTYPSGKVLKVAVFNDDGVFLSPGIPDASNPQTFLAPYPQGQSAFFLYLEYTGQPSLEFSLAQTAVPSGNTVSVVADLSGLTNVAGHTFLCGLDTGIEGGTGPVAVGIAAVSPTGTVQAYLQNTLTGAMWDYGTGGTYYLSAMVDMADVYKNMLFSEIVAQLATVMPLNGDYMTIDKGIPVTVSGSGLITLELLSSDFTQMNEVQIFASGTATGTGDGLSPANATTLNNAITAALGYAAVGEVKPPIIYLVDSATLSGAVTINSNVAIASMGAPVTITLDATASFSISPATSEPIGLYLRNVNVDGGSLPGRAAPAFTVNALGNLKLEESTVSNFSWVLMPVAVSNGGAVSVLGGHLGLSNSSITNCTADNGGAVYVGPNGSMEMFSSTISYNMASTGAGIYGAANSVINLGPGAEITQNGTVAETNQGGGVYTEGYLSAQAMDASGSPYIFDNFAVANPEYYALNSVDTTIHTLFVSQTGGDTGLSYEAPTTLAYAMAQESVNEIMLVSDITLSTTLTPAFTAGYNRYIRIHSPYEDVIRSIIPAAGMASSLFTVPVNVDLDFERVILGVPDTATKSSLSSLVSVTGGTLHLRGETVLRNNASPGSGGAVSASGGSVLLQGATIYGCTAVNNGGAVSATDYCSVDMNAGTVTGNTAGAFGGAFYLSTSSNFSIYAYPPATAQGNGLVKITGNRANSGGGLYLEATVGYSPPSEPIEYYVYGNTSLDGTTVDDIVQP